MILEKVGLAGKAFISSSHVNTSLCIFVCTENSFNSLIPTVRKIKNKKCHQTANSCYSYGKIRGRIRWPRNDGDGRPIMMQSWDKNGGVGSTIYRWGLKSVSLSGSTSPPQRPTCILHYSWFAWLITPESQLWKKHQLH